MACRPLRRSALPSDLREGRARAGDRCRLRLRADRRYQRVAAGLPPRRLMPPAAEALFGGRDRRRARARGGRGGSRRGYGSAPPRRRPALRRRHCAPPHRETPPARAGGARGRELRRRPAAVRRALSGGRRRPARALPRSDRRARGRSDGPRRGTRIRTGRSPVICGHLILPFRPPTHGRAHDAQAVWRSAMCLGTRGHPRSRAASDARVSGRRSESGGLSS